MRIVRAGIVLLALQACTPENSTDLAVRPPGPTEALTTGPLAADNSGENDVVPASLTGSGVRSCADPNAREQSKFDLIQTAEAVQPYRYRAYGAGVVGGDFDRDGRTDFVLLSAHLAERYQQVSRGVFEQIDTGYDWSSVDRGVGGTAADFDADGDLDLFISRYGAENLLLRNDGAGNFTDVAGVAGVASCGDCDDPVRGCSPERHRSTSSAWGDVDRDGDLDLLVTGHGLVDEVTPVEEMPPGEPSCLFLNNGDGTFADASDRLPQRVHDGYSFIPALIDLDEDGWLDLYTMNDFGAKQTACNLSWNDHGSFVSDLNAAGLDVPTSCMGLGIGDQNDDGQYDFLISAWGENRYLLSRPDLGLWVDASGAQGPVGDPELSQKVAWGNVLVDLDNDADLDAVMMYGFIRTNSAYNGRGQSDGLWLNTGDGTLEQVSEQWGFEHLSASRGVLATDLDGNGWVDLVIPSLDGPGHVYLARCGQAGWLNLALRQSGANRDAVGARVYVTANGKTQMQTLFSGGTSYGMGGPPTVHFGLGDVEMIAQIEVVWPDGARSILIDVPSRQQVQISRD